jgi:peptidoglycan/LPS O-acetylase OafA/YrhL
MHANTHNTASSQDFAYRPEIDGLRCIAVLSVVFFHINSTWLAGGFIGVDVFFVISGYLISRQILKDINSNTFTLKNFYLRRVRRILPPLLLMLLVCSVAALVILTPEDIRSFVSSLLAQALSLQNFVFLAEGDYFIGADTKPLLHTWSLAVEEQFYFFWPLLLLLFRKQSGQARLAIVVLVILGSFYINLVQSQSAPRAAFFLIFSRAWELAIGGFAALLENQSTSNKIKQVHREVVLVFSLLCLFFSLYYIDSSMSFPGKIALLPVVTVFTIILLTRAQNSIVGKLLSNPLLVGIGLISYPLYLWHWPILVFMRHLQISTTHFASVSIFLLLTFTLAYSSYRWVETPIRRKIIFSSTNHLLAAISLVFLALIAYGLHVFVTDGASYRYNENVKSFLTSRINSRTTRCSAWSLIRDQNPTVCRLVDSEAGSVKSKKVMIWGNSHAGMWLAMLEQLAKESNTSLLLNTKNCRPIIGQFDCPQSIKTKVMAEIEMLGLDDIILASSWQGIADPNLSKQLTELVELLSNKKIRVWLVIDPPIGDALDPLVAYAKDSKHPVMGNISFEHYNRTHRSNELALFSQLKMRFQNVNIIDPSDIFCNPTLCLGGYDNQVWYRDATHLNNYGAQAARHKFAPIFLTHKLFQNPEKS